MAENGGPPHNDTGKSDVDLEKEVSHLSTRLIEAIDKQVDLGDQVKVLRKELDSARRQNLALEDKINSGEYVTRSVKEEAEKLRDEALAEAAKLRGETVDLTSKLFDEANVLVAGAKRETADIQRKNDSLQAQIDEKDTLLEALQQQLTELKLVLENATQRDQIDSATINNRRISSRLSTGPSSTGSSKENSESPAPDRELAEMPNWELTGDEYLFSPYRPAYRYDLPQFKEFSFMAQGLHVSNPSGSTAEESSPRFHFFGNSLKEFKFFKRALADDIEPTLRLDQAPGISWLGRRSITSAIFEGTVVIQPIASVNERSSFSQIADQSNDADRPIATLSPCAFCGESRNSHLIYARMHNLRVDEKTDNSTGGKTITYKGTGGKVASGSTSSETAGSNSPSGTGSAIESSDKDSTPVLFTRTTGNSNEKSAPSSSAPAISNGYPMCHHCLTRVRAVCDFVSAIRSIRDGLWKIGTFETNARAWQECQKLRERMFYARIGARFMINEKRDIEIDRQASSNLEENHVTELPDENNMKELMTEHDKKRIIDGDERVDSSDEEAEFLDTYDEGIIEESAEDEDGRGDRE